MVDLKRVNVYNNLQDKLVKASKVSWDQLISEIKSSQLCQYETNVSDKCKPSFHSATKVDIVSKRLYPSDAPTDLTPIPCYGDGNCFWRAASQLVFGIEQNFTELRLKAVAELSLNEDLYLDEEYLRKVSEESARTSPRLLEYVLNTSSSNPVRTYRETFRNIVMSTLKNGEYSTVLHMYALPNVLQRSVRYLFPEVSNVALNRSIHNQTIAAREVSQAIPITIMWTHGTNTNKMQWTPNHFVACVKLDPPSDERCKPIKSPEEEKRSMGLGQKSKKQKTLDFMFSKQKPPSDSSTCLKDMSSANVEVPVSEESIETKSDESSDASVDTESVSADDMSICDCKCCHGGGDAFQPSDKKLLKKTAITSKGRNPKSRTFQTSWYRLFPWLSVCTTTFKVFCCHCKDAYSKMTKDHFPKTQETTFVLGGFNNWKKALKSFRRHQVSQLHRDATAKRTVKESVVEQLSVHAIADQDKMRGLLLAEISSVVYLARQGLALRGHTDEESNLFQLLKLQAKHINGLSKWLEDKKYMSPPIINEILQLLSHSLLKKLLAQIQSAKYFTLMADETRDLSNKEQLVVSIRWVDDNFVVNEDVIGLYEVPKTDASTLTDVLKDSLVRCELSLSNCRGQCYDGARTFQGHVRGVAKQIQDEEPRAIAVHCLAHCVNLVLQEAGRKCKPLQDALDVTTEVTKIFKNSPKRENLFDTRQKAQAKMHRTHGLRPLCPTRWTVRTSAMESMLENYSLLQETLHEINEEGKDEYARIAGGLVAQLENFSVFYGLKLSTLVFSASEHLSIVLQGVDTNVQQAQKAAEHVISYYKTLRSDEKFHKTFEAAVKASEGKTQAPCLPRFRRLPQKLDDGSAQHKFGTIEEYYRQQYFEVLDLLVGELQRRFDQSSFNLVKDLENLLLNAANGSEVMHIPESIQTTYKDDVDFKRLKMQFAMLPDSIKAVGSEMGRGAVKKVTLVDTIVDTLNSSPVLKSMFSEVSILLQLYLTIPVTTASSERCFSCLRRLKTYLRTSMTQQRLNSILLLHTHKQLTDDLSVQDVAEEFIALNDRRRSFFGKFD